MDGDLTIRLILIDSHHPILSQEKKSCGLVGPSVTRQQETDSDGCELLSKDDVVRGEVGLFPECATAEVKAVRVREPVHEVELRRPAELSRRLLDRREEML
jgi:hypothetical protein